MTPCAETGRRKRQRPLRLTNRLPVCLHRPILEGEATGAGASGMADESEPGEKASAEEQADEHVRSREQGKLSSIGAVQAWKTRAAQGTITMRVITALKTYVSWRAGACHRCSMIPGPRARTAPTNANLQRFAFGSVWP